MLHLLATLKAHPYHIFATARRIVPFCASSSTPHSLMDPLVVPLLSKEGKHFMCSRILLLIRTANLESGSCYCDHSAELREV